MAGKAVVPKFGSWDAENIGYTVFFEKVRENKTAPVPAAAAAPKAAAGDDYEFDPYEHYETLSSRTAPSRPASSHGHGPAPAPPPQRHYYPAAQPPPHHGGPYHRRTGSNGSSVAASESASSRGGSKFSPPRPYQTRYGNNHQAQAQARHQYPAQHAAPRVPAAGPSPPRYAPPAPANERRHGQGAQQGRANNNNKAPSAVPKFGVWDDEKNAAAGAQGYTVQFEKVKRHRAEVATKAAAVPDVLPRRFSPERPAASHRQQHHPRRKAKTSFLSKVYGCLFPVVRH